MPTYFYQQVSQFFELIFAAVQDPKLAIRESAVQALRAALIVTAQRESSKTSQKLGWYKQCYDETIKLLSVEKGEKVKEERVHGALLVLNELVRCSNAEWERTYTNLMKLTDTKQDIEEHLTSFNKSRFMPFTKRSTHLLTFNNNPFNNSIIESSVCKQLIFEKYDYVCLDVLAQRTTRYPHIHNALLMILPRLAAFSKERFIKNYLAITMSYLQQTLRSREKERFQAFITTGLIAVAIEDDINPYIPKIMEVIRSALPNKEIQQKKRVYIDCSIFQCVTFLGHALKSNLSKEMHSIIDPMLITGLTSSLTICLRELAKKIPELKQIISSGLLKMLSQILMNTPLRHPGMPKHLSPNLMTLSGSGEVADTGSIVLALRTLGTFDFERQSLLQFVKHCADFYLIHEQQEIRLESVRTCSR